MICCDWGALFKQWLLGTGAIRLDTRNNNLLRGRFQTNAVFNRLAEYFSIPSNNACNNMSFACVLLLLHKSLSIISRENGLQSHVRRAGCRWPLFVRQ
jgi:hypothetical protein